MEPFFSEGSRIVINRWAYLFSSPKIGDVVAFSDQKEPEKILLKKIEKVRGESYFYVAGINKKDSLDSRFFGYVKKNLVLGKFFARL